MGVRCIKAVLCCGRVELGMEGQSDHKNFCDEVGECWYEENGVMETRGRMVWVRIELWCRTRCVCVRGVRVRKRRK